MIKTLVMQQGSTPTKRSEKILGQERQWWNIRSSKKTFTFWTESTMLISGEISI